MLFGVCLVSAQKQWSDVCVKVLSNEVAFSQKVH